MPRSALIVDDSRTALAALSRLLKAQGLNVDTVESGPEAIDTLRNNAHIGMVFLDHMMPGMDGFETLALLKRNPGTADIPVVMYTSREGDAYMGQALALGAVGVLHKPVNPAELSAILHRVDRLRGSRPEPAAPAGTPRAARTGVIDVPEEFRSPLSSPAAPAGPRQPPVPTVHGRRRWTTAMLALLAIAVPVALAGFYQRYAHNDLQRKQLTEQVGRLQAELDAARTAMQDESDAEARRLPRRTETRALLDALSWALSLRGQYGFQEEPLNDTRLSLVRELIARLSTAGFRGMVRLETHVGEFCVVRDDQGGFRLPPDATAFARCEVLSYPLSQADMLGQRQSPAFARYLAQPRDDSIKVSVVTHGTRRPLAAYPEMASAQTAGDWNRSARINQRVEIALVPAP